MKADTRPPKAGADPQPKEAVAYAKLLKMAHEAGLKSIKTGVLVPLTRPIREAGVGAAVAA